MKSTLILVTIVLLFLIRADSGGGLAKAVKAAKGE